MAYVPGDNVLQVEIVGSLHAQVVENTLYFQDAGGWGGAAVDFAFDTVESFLGTLASWVSDDLSWTRLEATDLTTQTSPTYTRVLSPPIIGINGDPALPGSVAFCVSFRTNGRGRSSRGRNYVPGLPETQVTGNALSSTSISGMLAAYESLRVAMQAGSRPMGVFSRYANGAPRAQGLFQPITSIVATDIFVDSQRRRLSGRGPAG